MRVNSSISFSLRLYKSPNPKVTLFTIIVFAFAFCCHGAKTQSESDVDYTRSGTITITDTITLGLTDQEQKRFLRPANKNNGNGDGNGNGTGNRPTPCGDAEKYDVVVVGAGWAGITTVKLLDDYNKSSTKAINDFNFTVLEKSDRWQNIGRGVSARYLMGANTTRDYLTTTDATNPVAKMLVEQLKEIKGDKDEYENYKKDVSIVGGFDGTNADYFDEYVGTSASQQVEKVTAQFEDTIKDFKKAYKCLEDKAETVFDGPSGNKDQSMRDVLKECGWAPPTTSSVNRSIEYGGIDYEWSSTPDIMGLYNFPVNRPNNDYNANGDWFLKAPLINDKYQYASSASIGVKYIKDHNLKNHIKEDTGVAKIYWDNDDGSRYPVMIKTESSICYDILANRVIFTPSVGVLEHRGDCRHADGSNGNPENCDATIGGSTLPLFDPVLPFLKTEATERLYIDRSRDNNNYPAKRAGMADYIEVRFQFMDDFWTCSSNNQADCSNKDYLLFYNESGCRMWQNHEKTYQGSKAMSCTINSDQLDFITRNNDPGDTKEIDVEEIRKLYANSLGLLTGAPTSDQCIEISNRAWYPGNMAQLNQSYPCGYSYFPSWIEDEKNDRYSTRYGSYVTWNVGKNFGALDQDFIDYTDPLRSNGKNRVYFSGSGVCDRHQGWVQGAVYAAIKITKQMLGDIDPGYDTSGDEWKEYCDVGPDGKY